MAGIVNLVACDDIDLRGEPTTINLLNECNP